MNLIRLCLDRPVAVSVGVLLTVLFGLLSLFVIPIQLTPNVDVPIINVQTSWIGANPQEVEREILDRQEEQLRSVKGLRRMTGKAQDNQAQITLEFYNDVDRGEALRDVTDKLRQVANYPPEVDEPTVQAADTSRDSEIAWLVLRATDGNDARLPELYDFAKNYIKPYLDRVKGVASTDIYGGMQREVRVRVDAGRLAARGLTFRQVEDALRNQNANISAGTRSQGKRDYAVRTVGQYRTLEEILNTVIAYTAGGPVYVRDVAEVESGFRKQRAFVRSVGEYVLAFPVRREVGANVMEVMRELRGTIQRINADVLTARGTNLELKQVYDETVYIDQAIGMVESSAVFGSILTVVVLMVFLRNWRATAALGLAIPISVIGTFLVVVMSGRTLNVVSLAGIAFAIGMVVDNSIVVLENIYRHREMGKDVKTACLDGTREVWGAVLASTLTTLAVFIPVIFIREEAGQLFRDISIATAASVGLSLLVSVTVLPPLARRILSIGGGGAAGWGAAVRAGSGRRGLKVRALDLLEWTNRHRLLRPTIIVLMTGVSLVGARLLVPATTYLPMGNQNLVFGILLTPPGYSLDEFKRMGAVIESVVRPYWSASPGSPEHKALDERWRRMVQGLIAASAIPELAAPASYNPLAWLEHARLRREWETPPPLVQDFFFVAFDGIAFMGCTSRDAQRVRPLTRLLSTSGQQIPGTFAYFQQFPIFRVAGGNDAEIQIRGDDLEQVTAAAAALQGELMARFGFPQPDPPNFSLGRPEVTVEPDRERAADLGLNVRDVGFIVEACVDGAFVGEYRAVGADSIDIALHVKGQSDRPTQEIAQVPIWTPSGRVVPLGAAVRLRDTSALEQIKHIERQRAVTLTVNPPETVPLEVVIDQTKELVTRLREAKAIHPDVIVSLTGNADKLKLARATMVGEWKGWTVETLINLIGSRFFLSVLICYLLMVALYESWVYPFVIMFSVPLAIFGGFLGLWVCHVGTLLSTDQAVQQLDVLTFLGFVILVGTVVNNAILLVDQSLQNLRLRGMELHAAVREAVRTRVRPVLMTSLTTVCGQLPLAVMPGAGSELYRGLASVTVGGLLVATLGTLVLVPMVLTTVLEWRLARRGVAVEPAAGAVAGEPGS